MVRFPRFIGGQTTVTSLCILALWVIFNGVGRADWKADWEKTVAAAKKEGQLNFYVGRYGTEPLLNEFRKDYPEIKIISVNATGNQLGTRIISEIRAGKVIADLYSGGANTNYEILYKGKALDSIRSALILARGGRREQMVRRTASLHRPGAKIHIRLHRHSLVVGFLLQHRVREFERKI